MDDFDSFAGWNHFMDDEEKADDLLANSDEDETNETDELLDEDEDEDFSEENVDWFFR